MTPAEQLKEKVESLKNALLSAHPTMPVLLREIHNNLKADPEIVTLLSEEEICTIVQGLQKQTNTVIATSISKSGTKGKSMKSLTVDDL